MTAQKGRLVILKIGDGGAPETFSTIGGFRKIRMELTNRVIESTKVTSGAWRELLNATGPNKLVATGEGLFTDSTAEEALRQAAFGNIARNFSLHFENGDDITGSFIVAAYEREGQLGEEEIFRLTLESAGQLTYNAA